MVLLLALMFYYNSQSSYLVVFLPCLAGGIWYLLFSSYITANVLSTLQTSVIPIILLSRVGPVILLC